MPMNSEESKAFAAHLLNEDMKRQSELASYAAQPVTEGVPAVLAPPPPAPAPPPPAPPPGIAAPVPVAAPAAPDPEAAPPVEEGPPPLTSSASLAPRPLVSGAQYDRNLAASTDMQHQANAIQQGVETEQHAAQKDANKAEVVEGHKALQVADEEAAKQQLLRDQNEADLGKEIEDHKRLYAQNPANWWANHGTQGRIGVSLSMIGAGLAGKDVNKVLFDLIDRDTAEAARQDENLTKLGALQTRKYTSGVGASRDRMAAMNARKVAALGIVQDELKGKILNTADDATKARLMAADAGLELAKNDKHSNEMHARYGESVQAAQIHLQEQAQQLTARGQDMSLLAARAKAAQAAHNGYVPVQDFNGPGVPKTTSGKELDQVLASKDALYGLGEMQKVVADIEKNGLSRLNATQLSAVKAQLEGTLRKYVGTGANLSPEEKANVDSLSADIKGLAIEKLTGFSLSKRVQMTQRAIAHHYDHAVNAFGLERQAPKEGSDVYNILHDEEAQNHTSNEAQSKDQAELDAVMSAQDTTPTAKALQVAAMAHMGNGAAKLMLDQHTEEARANAASMGGAAGAQ